MKELAKMTGKIATISGRHCSRLSPGWFALHPGGGVRGSHPPPPPVIVPGAPGAGGGGWSGAGRGAPGGGGAYASGAGPGGAAPG